MRPFSFRLFPGLILMGFVLFFLPFLLLKLAFFLFLGSFALRLIFRRPRYYRAYYAHQSRPDTIYAIPEEEYDMPFRGNRNYSGYYGSRSKAFQPNERIYRDRDFVSPLIKI